MALIVHHYMSNNMRLTFATTILSLFCFLFDLSVSFFLLCVHCDWSPRGSNPLRLDLDSWTAGVSEIPVFSR